MTATGISLLQLFFTSSLHSLLWRTHLLEAAHLQNIRVIYSNYWLPCATFH
jgi:hypothetical protein